MNANSSHVLIARRGIFPSVKPVCSAHRRALTSEGSFHGTCPQVRISSNSPPTGRREPPRFAPTAFRRVALTIADTSRDSGAWQEQQTSTAPASLATVLERLRRVSARSKEALLRLPNKGQPSIGGDGMLREYRGVDASELPDPGHRHSSGLWALYPGFQVRCGGISGARRGGIVCSTSFPLAPFDRQCFCFCGLFEAGCPFSSCSVRCA